MNVPRRKALGRSGMANMLAKRLGHDDAQSVDRAKIIVDTFLEILVEEIRRGGRVEFRGAFTMDSKIQSSRMALNPKTLEKVRIPERRVLTFRKGEGLKDLPMHPRGRRLIEVYGDE